MVTLVLGGSGCGKSAFAEKQMMQYKGPLYYLATMMVYGQEGEKKVARHHALRAGKGFATIEQKVDIHLALQKMQEQRKGALLECMSNLVANEMFREERMLSAREVTDKVLAELEILQQGVEELVIVSVNVFEDGIQYDEGTMEYMKALGKINQVLAQRADRVYEMVVGIPVCLKEEK